MLPLINVAGEKCVSPSVAKEDRKNEQSDSLGFPGLDRLVRINNQIRIKRFLVRGSY